MHLNRRRSLKRVHPKELLKEARLAETEGNLRRAANLFASLSAHLRHKGKTSEARNLILHAKTLSPDSPKLDLQLALCESELKNLEAAKQLVWEFGARAVESEKVGDLRAHAEKHLAAHAVLREAFYRGMLNKDQSAGPVYLALAKTLWVQQKPKLAMESLLQCLELEERHPDALDLLDKVVGQLHPGEDAHAVRRYRDGEWSYHELAENLGQVAAEPAPNPIEENTNAGLSELKGLRDLVEELERELSFDDVTPESSIDSLVALFRKSSDPIIGKDARLRMDLACAFFQMGRHQDAKEELLQIDPKGEDSHQVQNLLGQVLTELGDLIGALNAFQEAARGVGENEEAKKEAFFQLAQVYYKLSDFKQAEKYLSEVEAIDPRYRQVPELRAALKKRGPVSK